MLQKFACGVVARNGQHLLVDRGSLPEAVTASAAVPFLFANVDIPGKYPTSSCSIRICQHLLHVRPHSAG